MLILNILLILSLATFSPWLNLIFIIKSKKKYSIKKKIKNSKCKLKKINKNEAVKLKCNHHDQITNVTSYIYDTSFFNENDFNISTIENSRTGLKKCKCGSSDHVRTSNKDCSLFREKLTINTDISNSLMEIDTQTPDKIDLLLSYQKDYKRTRDNNYDQNSLAKRTCLSK